MTELGIEVIAISNFFLCDVCCHKLVDLLNEDESFPLPTDCVCEKLGYAKKKIMWDHGRGRGYDEPLDVCADFMKEVEE